MAWRKGQHVKREYSMSYSFFLWTLCLSLLQMPPPHPQVLAPAPLQPGETPLPPHPPFEGKAPAERFDDLPDVVSRLDQTEGLREAPKTFEIALSIASEYAKAGRHEDAAFFFGQAFEKTAGVRELFARLQTVEVGGMGCEEVNADKELAFAFAQAQEQQTPEKQAACVRLFIPKVVDTGKQLALFQVLAKDLEGAKKTWEALWAMDNASLEASYALGVLLLETEGEDMASLGRAQKLLRPVATAGTSQAKRAKVFLARVEAALEAGGNSKVKRPRAKVFKPAWLGGE